jgi:histidinol phosphatase-like PHP family hydrolase
MEVDLEDILHAAREHDVALEINSSHSRSSFVICPYIGHAN